MCGLTGLSVCELATEQKTDGEMGWRQYRAANG